MTLNLNLGARPDERFHLQPAQPVPHSWGWRWLVRRVSWSALMNPDGSVGEFTSWTICWGLQIYHGSVKCDGSRTMMYRTGQLGEPYSNEHFVMTTTPKERFAFRIRRGGTDPFPHWSNMGGA